MKTCNQCGHELVVWDYEVLSITNEEEVLLTACDNPLCPNYALLQIPAEDMPKEDKRSVRK